MPQKLFNEFVYGRLVIGHQYLDDLPMPCRHTMYERLVVNRLWNKYGYNLNPVFIKFYAEGHDFQPTGMREKLQITIFLSINR